MNISQIELSGEQLPSRLVAVKLQPVSHDTHDTDESIAADLLAIDSRHSWVDMSHDRVDRDLIF